jgi:hypothetical protein
MSATFSALVGDMGVLEEGIMSGGQLGTASFAGALTLEPGGGGTMVVTEGPFQGATGTWSAQLGGVPVVAIPTLGAVGVIGLSLLLSSVGVFVLRRPWRRPDPESSAVSPASIRD